MKGALWIAFWLLSIAAAREIDREPMPLAIEATPAQADRWCDFPKNAAPLPKKRLNPIINGLDKPNGDIA